MPYDLNSKVHFSGFSIHEPCCHHGKLQLNSLDVLPPKMYIPNAHFNNKKNSIVHKTETNLYLSHNVLIILFKFFSYHSGQNGVGLK